jgi:transposase
MGWYREARVRSLDAQFVQSLLLSRQQLLQSRRAIENQIRGALKTLGVMTGSTKGRAFMPRVVELGADNEWLGPMLDPLLAARASIAAQLKIVSANVLDTAREDADVVALEGRDARQRGSIFCKRYRPPCWARNSFRCSSSIFLVSADVREAYDQTIRFWARPAAAWTATVS